MVGKKKPNAGVERQSLSVSREVRDRLNDFATERGMSQSEAVAFLLGLLEPLQRAGIKIRNIPARTELEFPK